MLPALPSPNTAHHVHLDNSNAQRTQSGSTTPKRNSSMIFRIEHLLPLSPPPTTAPVSETGGVQANPHAVNATSHNLPPNSGRRAKFLRTPGVYLKQFTPKDTVSDAISTLALMSANSGGNIAMPEQQHRPQETFRAPQTRTYCALMQSVLRMTPSAMRKVKLSEDIHSYNALFEVHNGDIRLRIVRDIARDEELIAWFDEEVTLLMAIPFLAPMNIQGNNRYTCHFCQLSFETPNPLKIHIALSCGRHSLDILWIRLHYACRSAAFGQHTLPMHHLAQNMQLLPAVHRSPEQAACSTSSVNTISMIASPQPQSQQLQRFSAFKPITPSGGQASPPGTAASSSTILIATTTTAAATMPTLTLPLTAHSSNTIGFPPTGMTPMTLLQPPGSSPLNAAAQIEAIVSNMGASKQGHLCIYCGKVYSRKYGLKIHIRTHTGFKPLKCKYCLRPFGDPSNLNKHVRLHLQSSSNLGEAVEGYKCHLCHKTLARRRDLQRHIESRHSSGS